VLRTGLASRRRARSGFIATVFLLQLAWAGPVSGSPDSPASAAAVAHAAPNGLVAATASAALIRTIDSGAWSPPSPDSSGIAYSPSLGRFVVVDGEVEETVDGMSHWAGANVWEMATSGSVSATWSVRASGGDPAISNEPVGVAVNPADGHVFISDDGQRRIWELDTARDVVATIDTGAGDPEGLAFGGDSIYVADGLGREVWRIRPGNDGSFGTADDVETHFDVGDWINDPEGIEYDPATGRLFVLSSRAPGQAGSGLLDVTVDGTFVRVVDINALSQAIKPSGLAKGPSGTYFVTDRGVDFNPNPAPSDGKIYEISIPAASPPPPAVPNTTITSGPAQGSTTTSTSASFEFTGTNSPTAFECKLDGGAFVACTSPQAYSGLAVGSHTFEVRAINAAGTDATPASRTWTVQSGSPSHPFTDVADTNQFLNDIIWLYNEGITRGCNAAGTLFCPTDNVRRDEMATFLDRALGLPTTSSDFFSDDNGNQHEAAINRLAAAGITLGCGGGRYCPAAAVTRAEMATFLVRAYGFASTGTDFFSDDEATGVHEANINALRAAGVTNGCNAAGTLFCPNNPVTREQMAAFIHRAET
jgi:hypothetical protein